MNSYIKRPRVWGTALAVVAIIVIAFAFFYPDAPMGNLLRQPDMQQGMAIGQEAKAWHEATGETPRWTNSLFGGMPTFQINPTYPSSSLFSWITSVYGLGLPAPANLLVMMMLGFLILMLAMRLRWYVALTGAIAYGLSSYFIIIIGAGHIWKFVTLAYVPPTIAGIILIYRGRYLLGTGLTALFMMMQIASNHVQMTYYFGFVIAGFVVAYLCEAIAARRLRRWAGATAIAVAACAVGVAANLPSLYNTYEYSKETIRGRHSDLTAESGTRSAGLDRDYITQYSYGGSETFSLLIPNIKGGASARPEGGQMVGLTLADLPQAQDMYRTGTISAADAQNLPAFSQYFGEPEGTNGPVYVGAAIVALFILGCIIVRGPLKWVLLALTLLSVGLALGRNMMWLTDLFIDYVPLYSKFRTVESILVIAEFTMPLLAMLALQTLVTTTGAWPRYRKAILWSFIPVAVICFIGWVAPSTFGDYLGKGEAYMTEAGYPQQMPALFLAVKELRFGVISADSLRSLLFVAAAFIVVILAAKAKIRSAAAAVTIGALVLIDLYTVDKRYLSHSSFCSEQLSAQDPFAPTRTDLEILADTAMNYRVLDIPRFYRPDPSYHHKMLGGYHAAKLTRYQDLIDNHLVHFTKVGYVPELRNDSIAATLVPDDPELLATLRADLRVIDMLNTRYIIGTDGALSVNPHALGNAWFVSAIDYVDTPDEEMAALSVIDPAREAVADVRFRDVLGEAAIPAPGDTIVETTYAPGRLTYAVSSVHGGVAVFSEVFFPWGWHADIDGEPASIGRVDYLLRAMRIPAGDHTITMTFDPQSIHVTDTVATIAVIIIYLIIIAGVAAAVIAIRRGNSHKHSDEQA